MNGCSIRPLSEHCRPRRRRCFPPSTHVSSSRPTPSNYLFNYRDTTRRYSRQSRSGSEKMLSSWFPYPAGIRRRAGTPNKYINIKQCRAAVLIKAECLFLSFSLTHDLSLYLSIHLLYLSIYLLYPSIYLLNPSIYLLYPSIYLLYPSIYLLYPSIYLLYPSIYLLYPSINLLYSSIYLSLHLSIHLLYLSIHPSPESIYLSLYLSIYPSIYCIHIPIYLSIYPSIYRLYTFTSLFIYLSIYSIHPSSYLMEKKVHFFEPWVDKTKHICSQHNCPVLKVKTKYVVYFRKIFHKHSQRTSR